jgi:hypothetical protein
MTHTTEEYPILKMQKSNIEIDCFGSVIRQGVSIILWGHRSNRVMMKTEHRKKTKCFCCSNGFAVSTYAPTRKNLKSHGLAHGT